MNDEQAHISSNPDSVAPESDTGHTPHSKSATSGASSNDPSATPTQGSAPPLAMVDTGHVEENQKGDGGFRKTVSKPPKKRASEWPSPPRRQGPLKLLDLPVDVLKEIVSEITHTNDLTALALTHSALHSLAIPHIYSRFDIVWPDATSTSDTRTGVDALTYGLSTLVMSHRLYEPLSLAQEPQPSDADASATPPPPGSRLRIGNNYSMYTRKFSLGNGPSDWVQDYMITKESGKMLGTLVALAVARMVNLETFVWDMPTGVLRDVFLSLSSLERNNKPGECRLEKFLVRWHDNSFDQPTPPGGSSLTAPGGSVIPPNSIVTSIGIPLPQDNLQHPLNPHFVSSRPASFHNAVEHPTLSVLPPLKSLSVLDIDEVSYLDEMSVLIERSKDRLQALRVGISRKACERPFVMPWDSVGLHQVDHDQTWPGAQSKIGDLRLGGVLGVIMGRVFDIHRSAKAPVALKSEATIVPDSGQTDMLNGIEALNLGGSAASEAAIEQHSHLMDMVDQDISSTNALIEGAQLLPADHGDHDHVEDESDPSKTDTEPLISDAGDADLGVSSNIISPAVEISQLNISQPYEIPASVNRRPSKKDAASEKSANESGPPKRKLLTGKLRLQVLELERVPLSIYVLQKAFDWTTLKSLTILDCAYHESLWRMLRRQFRPQLGTNSSKATPHMEYQLNLKHIHTDIATPSLISFLKDTLAPNTLEVLFLQDRRQKTSSSVTIDAIYKGPLRRHRKSLKKLLIDSSDRIPKGPSVSSENARWRTWMLSNEALSYITSGNMTSLKELSVAIDYRDWHFFLRRLPNIPGLRSLNIPFIGDHVTPAYDPKELAMQVVDMIFLRPEIELCYLGISNKCFEILENRPGDERHSGDEATTAHGELGEQMTEDEEDEDAESDADDDDADSEADDDDGTATEAVETEGAEYELSEDSDEFDGASEVDSDTEGNRMSLRLREILFYDDKVAIFKARHMRL
ncbi:hypothetical protein VE00_04044 [Pseudogymnoascus sp. WSF 3629]|nr:hypothetical protein VE00_04044 [Pseudogymnoascus sp. WSF 3629]